MSGARGAETADIIIKTRTASVWAFIYTQWDAVVRVSCGVSRRATGVARFSDPTLARSVHTTDLLFSNHWTSTGAS
jgi:hypothetical protein